MGPRKLEPQFAVSFFLFLFVALRQGEGLVKLGILWNPQPSRGGALPRLATPARESSASPNQDPLGPHQAVSTPPSYTSRGEHRLFTLDPSDPISPLQRPPVSTRTTVECIARLAWTEATK